MAKTTIHKKYVAPQEGQQYGLLTLVSFVERKGSQVRWLCRCVCGNEGVYIIDNLKRNHTKSCGCEQKISMSNRTKKHGMSRTRTYQCWLNMRNRCYWPKQKDFHNYGGRGITVCDEWKDSFENFFADMGFIPKGMTIDRIDGDGNYESSNCKWSSRLEQSRNRRCVKQIAIHKS